MAELGELPVKALERPEAIEDFKARRSGRAIATTNRYLARLRHVCNWAIGRDLPTATPFHRRGLRIVTKNERRRDRRVSEAEEQRVTRPMQAAQSASARQRETNLGRRQRHDDVRRRASLRVS